MPDPKPSPRRAPAGRRTTSVPARPRNRQQAERRSSRNKRLAIAAGATAVVGALVAVIVVVSTHGSKSASVTDSTDRSPAVLTGNPGPEGIPLESGILLAPRSTSADGLTVGGISCQADEQVAYHVHTHLTVYVNGKLRPIPAAIGMVGPVAQNTVDGPFYSATGCYYWLHVHAEDGVIHIESLTNSTYTLGQFFAVWGQPLSSTDVASAAGRVTAYVNGHRRSGNPQAITLGSHEDIQLDVGTPIVAPRRVDWAETKL